MEFEGKVNGNRNKRRKGKRREKKETRKQDKWNSCSKLKFKS